MNNIQGFSLAEILISLLLTIGILLALLLQQWHSHQLFNQLHLKNKAIMVSDNLTERRVRLFEKKPSYSKEERH